MSKPVSRRAFLADTLCLAAAVSLQGCGGVDWFPAFERQPTTPNPFSFTTKTGVGINTTVTSDPITVAGLTADSSPISITGPSGSNSQYSINGGTATSANGSVKNGDKVTVTHTSSTLPGASVTSTLTIGNVTGTFTSTTQLVAPIIFTAVNAAAGTLVSTQGVIVAVDGPAGHTIMIFDSANSVNSAFALDTAANFTHTQIQTAGLNGRTIFLQNRAPAAGTNLVTTLLIDGVASTWTINGT